MFFFPQMLDGGQLPLLRALAGFCFVFTGEILGDIVSPGAWLESALWPKKDTFLFQDSRNPGISLAL